MPLVRIARSLVVAVVLGSVAAHGAEPLEHLDRHDAETAGAALDRFTEQALERLRRRDDAEAWLSRAMLGVRADGSFAPRSALLQAALESPDADAHVLLRALSVKSATQLPADIRADALQRLRALDPGNLAVLELALADAVAAGDHAVDAWLAEAAATTHHRVYFGATLAMLVDAHAGIPVDAALADAVGISIDADVEVDAELAATVQGLGLVMALAMPALNSYVLQCDPHQAPAWSSQRAGNCLMIARVMAQHSDTIPARIIGATLWHRLVEGTDDEAEAIATKRSQRWLAEAAMALHDEEGDAAIVRRQVAAARAGRNELDVFRELLTAHGVSLTPPDAWMPADPAVLDARR